MDLEINFDYTPMTEEQAQRERYALMEDGTYDALVTNVNERPSSTGNAMGELSLDVYDNEGKVHALKDYLVFTPKMLWKIKHAADSAGFSKEFEAKQFRPRMLEGKNVKVNVRTQIGKPIPEDKLKGKAPGSVYPDRNVIDDYVMTDRGAVKYSSGPAHADMNDEIPF